MNCLYSRRFRVRNIKIFFNLVIKVLKNILKKEKLTVRNEMKSCYLSTTTIVLGKVVLHSFHEDSQRC